MANEKIETNTSYHLGNSTKILSLKSFSIQTLIVSSTGTFEKTESPSNDAIGQFEL